MTLTGQQYHLRAAKCYMSMGRSSDARRHYSRALELDPGNKVAVAEVAGAMVWRTDVL